MTGWVNGNGEALRSTGTGSSIVHKGRGYTDGSGNGKGSSVCRSEGDVAVSGESKANTSVIVNPGIGCAAHDIAGGKDYRGGDRVAYHLVYGLVNLPGRIDGDGKSFCATRARDSAICECRRYGNSGHNRCCSIVIGSEGRNVTGTRVIKPNGRITVGPCIGGCPDGVGRGKNHGSSWGVVADHLAGRLFDLAGGINGDGKGFGATCAGNPIVNKSWRNCNGGKGG